MAREMNAWLAAGTAALAVVTCGCSAEPAPAARQPSTVQAVVPATPAPAVPRPTPPPNPRTFDRKGLTRALDRYMSRRVSAASLVMVDRTTGITYKYLPTHDYVTASVSKVDILATLLLQNQPAHRKLTAAQRADAGVMIRYSDNEAADRLYTHVGGAAGVDAANRRLGLRHTHAVDGKCIDLLCWSLTRTTADDQVRLLQDLVPGGGPLTAKNRAYVLGLMGRVDKEQSWGVRAAAGKGDAVANKNGWMTHQADGDRWAINSIGRVRGHGHDYLIAVLTAHNPTMGYGMATAEHMVALAAQRFRDTTPWLS